MMIFDLLLDVFLGLVLHQSKILTGQMPRGWAEITENAVGVVGTSPAFLLWWYRLKSISSPVERAFIAYILSFLGVGSGVVLGWILDTWARKE